MGRILSSITRLTSRTSTLETTAASVGVSISEFVVDGQNWQGLKCQGRLKFRTRRTRLLCSEETNWTTGRLIDVHGGFAHGCTPSAGDSAGGTKRRKAA